MCKMNERQVITVACVDQPLVYADRFRLAQRILNERAGRRQGEKLLHSYQPFQFDFRSALEARFVIYQFLITDMRLSDPFDFYDDFRIGPNNLSRGAYIARLAKEKNPDIVTILLSGGADQISEDEKESFDFTVLKGVESYYRVIMLMEQYVKEKDK